MSPRHPIHGRFCENPLCRRAIDPGRPKGTKYCDSSCRGEAARIRSETGPDAEPAEPREPAQRRSRERRPTPYAVFRKRLVDDAVLFGTYELVGFATDTVKSRAIRKSAAGTERGHEVGDEYVAVPIKALDHYSADGDRIAERNPEWVVPFD